MIFSNKHSFLSHERFQAFYARGKRSTFLFLRVVRDITRNLKKKNRSGDIGDNDPTGPSRRAPRVRRLVLVHVGRNGTQTLCMAQDDTAGSFMLLRTD